MTLPRSLKPLRRVLPALALLAPLGAVLAQPAPAVRWSATVGAGDGAVAVAEDRVYSLGLFAPDGNTPLGLEKTPQASEVLLCLGAKDGQERWRRVVDRAKVARGLAWQFEHGVPRVADGRVYVRSAWGTLACYDANNGGRHWARSASDISARTMDHGCQSSPLLWGDIVIVACAVGQQRRDVRLLAFRAGDGKSLWQRPLGTVGLGHWSPPRLVRFRGQDRLIVFYNQYLLALDPADGSECWRFDGAQTIDLSGADVCSFGHTPEDANPPLVSGDIVMGECRYGMVKKMFCRSEYFAVRAEPNGPRLLWHRPDFVNWWDSQAVIPGGVLGIRRQPKGRFEATIARYAYREAEGKAALECRSAESGEAIWSLDHLLGPGVDHRFQAAVFAVEGERIYLHDEQRLIGGRISKDGYEYLWQLPIPGPAAQPVVAGEWLYLRQAPGGQLRAIALGGKGQAGGPADPTEEGHR